MQGKPPLAGRAALVTGAARRIGAAIARELHGAGANVVIHYHDSRSDAESLVAELNGLRNGTAAALAADLLDLASLQRLTADATAEFGRLDVLVNNASTFYATPVGTITAQQFDDLLGTNLRAPLFLAQACAPALRAAQGSIINLTDIHALRPLKSHTVYSVAKAGLIMLTRSLARELGPEIRVNAIAPGPVLWPESGLDAGLRNEIIEKTALKRSGAPDDVARAALYFATDASFVTGQVLAIDGGRSI
jgi:pteridine reductase